MSFLLGGKEKLAAGIRQFRMDYGLTQTQACVVLDVSLKTLQNIEAQSVVPVGRTLQRMDSAIKEFKKRLKK